jgi:hypothetical protein
MHSLAVSLPVMDEGKDIEGSKAHADHDEHPSRDFRQPSSASTVVWYKHPGLRRLYAMMPILFLGMTSQTCRMSRFLTYSRLNNQWLRWVLTQWLANNGPLGGL